MKKKTTSKKQRAALKSAKERRRGSDRRSGAIDLIYTRLVARKMLPERRKGDRRKD